MARRCLLGAIVLCAWAVPIAELGAQVVVDGTLRGALALRGPEYGITADLGRQLGRNLFFSFSQFSLIAGESATFSGPANVGRIISRVTGGSASSIDGAIRSTIAGADFYFINPAGVVFGPDASIDVGGSFHLSSAHYLAMGEGGRFDAADPAASTLTSAPPEAFGFLGGQGTIEVHGTPLIAAEGAQLSLVGGSIDVDQNAYLATSGGALRLAATLAPGEVPIAFTGVESSAPFNGQIRLHDGAQVQVSGTATTAPGSILMQGGRLEIDHATVLSSNLSDHAAGDIVLDASESISIAHGSVAAQACDYAQLGCGSGAGASLFLSAPAIFVNALGSVDSRTFGPAAGGDIRFDAAESLSILGLDPDQEGTERGIVTAATFGAGKGGDIQVRTLEFDVGLAGGIQTFVCGAPCFEGVDDAPVVPQFGSGGSIAIDADHIRLTGQGFFDAASFGNGHAGDLRIHATGSLTLTGVDEPRVPFEELSNTSISPFVSESGDGGTLNIVTPMFRMENGAQVISTTTGSGNAASVNITADVVQILDRAQLSTTTSGSGNAGDLHITAHESLSIVGDGGVVDNNSALAGETFSTGAGGSIFIDTSRLTLDQGGVISVSAFGDGAAGSVFVKAYDILLDGHSQIAASNYSGTLDSGPRAGDVGRIRLRARNSLVVTGSDETHSSGVLLLNFGTGDGGQLTVKTPRLAIDPFSLMSTATLESGSGGSIRVTADTVDLRGGVINAESAGTGNAGTIVVTAADALRLLNGGAITTSTTQSDGGDIDLHVGRLLYLYRSAISTSVAGELGNGGNIRIDPRFVVLNASDITADAFGGDGGNISIVADHFLPSGDSLVQASSALGIDGSISISSPVIDVGETLGQLSTAYLDASRSLRRSCAAGAQAASNSFIALGRGGFPRSAEGSLYGSLARLLAIPEAPGPDRTPALTQPSSADSVMAGHSVASSCLALAP